MARKVSIPIVSQYVSALTGRKDIVVANIPNAASSHMATGTIQIDLNMAHPFDTVAHEVGHHKHTASDAMRRARPEQRFLVNALEDARDDVIEMGERPGLRHLWDRGRIEVGRQLVYDEKNVTIQALKIAYLAAAGWSFDRSRLWPETRAFLDKFVAAGFPARVIAAKDAYEIIEIAAEVHPLLPWSADPPQPPTQPEPEAEDDEEDDESDEPDGGCGYPMPSPDADEEDDEDDEDESEDDEGGEGDEDAEDDESDEDGESGSGGDESEDDEPEDESEDGGSGSGKVESDEDGGEAGDGEADEDGKSGKSDGSGSGRPGDDDEDGTGKSSGSYDEYDADEARALEEIAKRNGKDKEDADEGRPSSFEVKEAEEVQKVTGGLTPAQLKDQAARLAKELMKKRWAERDRLAEADYDDYTIEPEPVRENAGATSSEIDASADKSVQKFGKVEENFGHIDLTEAVKACGAVGYRGGQVGLMDARDKGRQDVAMEIAAKSRPFSQYMVRVVRTLLTSQNMKGWRNRERNGRFDNTRSTALVRGDLNIYRQRIAPRNDKPSVMLLVDISGSMQADGVAFHTAVAATMFCEALAGLGIPFEVNLFNGALWVAKPYEAPWDAKARRAISNIVDAQGGTDAAAAIAYGWVRANTRRENKRIVIMLTDGSVSMNTAEVVKAVAKQPKATVIGIGIGAIGLDKFFPNNIVVSNAAALPGQFAALLKRLTLAGRL